ncbi:MAG: toll/interleukin-1 receptor domain-containing protein [Bacteroidetes bacterium]|nr:toll/interleukin-1 receptor domain-containing protein [Bacteroidota bacterium]
MTIYIAQDSTTSLKLSKVVKYLNSKCNYIKFEEIPIIVETNEEYVMFPKTHNKYLKQVKTKRSQNDFLIVLTELQYDNNYFFEGETDLIILSFFGWKYLTSLPIENGLVYFICGMLLDEVIPYDAIDHSERLGCVNDFLFDKTRVDDGMRKGHLCTDCKKYIQKHKLTEFESLLYSDAISLLKNLAISSSNERSILNNNSNATVLNIDTNKKTIKHSVKKSTNNGDSIFISYSHKDEKDRLKLEDHLKILQRLGLISIWTDRKIAPGEEWKGQIDNNINNARIILLLISSNFLASDYCFDIEMKTALKRHKNNETTAIPIILRDCLWQISEFAKLQALPLDGKPIQKFTKKDEAYASIARAIAKIIKEGK